MLLSQQSPDGHEIVNHDTEKAVKVPPHAYADPDPPVELRKGCCWVMWREEKRGDKATKIPYQPNGLHASVSDPATWSSYKDCLAVLPSFSGLGFVITQENGIVGIDLDKCRDAETGEVAPWASEIIELCGSYTETSPSGTGIHILVSGTLPKGARRRGHIEIYDDKRYFTFTGHRLEGTPHSIRLDASNLLETLHRKFLNGQELTHEVPRTSCMTVHMDDEDIVRRACVALNGNKFTQLWAGNWESAGYSSQSEADLALCCELAFWTARDRERIDRLFRRSGLYREKWERPEYRDGTIGKAIGLTLDTFGGRQARCDGHQAKQAGFSGPPEAQMIATASIDEIRATLLTDLANARRLYTLYGDVLRHSTVHGWLVWDGKRWHRSEKAARRYAQKIVQAVRDEVARFGMTDPRVVEAFYKHARASASSKGIDATLKEAQALPGIDADSVEWDSHPWLLNCPNGTVDLSTGALLPHDPGQFLTKLCATEYRPEARCPLFFKFLHQVTLENIDLVVYLKWALGYALTGSTQYDILFVLWGGGSNGKTTFLTLIQEVIGQDYAQQLDPEVLMIQKFAQHPTALARLRGARFVVAIETGESRHLNEALVKALTGGDRIVARYMHKDHFEFTPELKLFIGTNYRPSIRDASTGMWRRIRLLPFEAVFEGAKKDPGLPEKLRAEHEGILNWMVQGATQARKGEQRPPKCVLDATQEYRAEQDTLGQFLEDECEHWEDARAVKADMYRAYQAYMDGRCESKKVFGQRMEARGYEEARIHNGERAWKGVRPKPRYDNARVTHGGG